MTSLSDFREGGGIDEEEISAVEYACLNGLARNHLTDLSSSAILGPIQEAINTGLTDDSHLEQLYLPKDYCISERLTISKNGAQLLVSAMHHNSNEFVDGIMQPIEDGPKIRMICLELPLLRSDHEADVKEFARREVFEPQLKDVKLPLENLNIERNEGLDFSPSLGDLGPELLEEIKTEKIVVTKASLEYFQRSSRPDWMESDDKDLWEGMKAYTKVREYGDVNTRVLCRIVDMIISRILRLSQSPHRSHQDSIKSRQMSHHYQIQLFRSQFSATRLPSHASIFQISRKTYLEKISLLLSETTLSMMSQKQPNMKRI
jgi:hypothetical protein